MDVEVEMEVQDTIMCERRGRSVRHRGASRHVAFGSVLRGRSLPGRSCRRGGKEVTPPAELALHDGSTGDGQHEQLEAVSVRVRPVGARECEHGDAGPGCTRRA